MATRAERAHADEQKKGPNKKTIKKAAAKKAHRATPKNPRAKAHAEKKATYALEETGTKRSRKSTRKAANRAKPDAAKTIHQENAASAPKSRARRSSAATKKVRGKS